MGKLLTYAGDFLLCLLLAPAGVLKIAHRQMKRKEKLIKGGEKVLIVGGVFLIIFGILVADAIGTVDSEMITNPFFYLYGAGGILGAVLGVLMMLRGKRYNLYRSAVEDHDLLTVEEIASMTKQPEKTVVRDLLRMIADGFFPDLRFDLEGETLRLKDYAVVKKQSKAVQCVSCGAMVTVLEGERNRCEYCGAALNY